MVKADRGSMAHGLEVRSPFLDTHWVDMTSTLPTSLKIDSRRGKLLFREAVSDLLPDRVRSRGKQGFGLRLTHCSPLMTVHLSISMRYQMMHFPNPSGNWESILLRMKKMTR